MFAYKNKQAFSLLELSLVIIVIGLLIAGSTSGIKILRKAQIQTSYHKLINFKFAYQNFQDNYFAKAGDITNAHSYFDNGSNEVCGVASDCNGNGNNILELSEKHNSETIRAWQHLYLANMIDKEYLGYWNANNKSVPKAALTSSFISFSYDNILKANILRLGSFISYKGEYSDGGLISSKEAFNLDNKFDDGNPDSGIIIGYNSIYLDQGMKIYSEDCKDGSSYKTYNQDLGYYCNVGFLLNQ